MHEFDHNNDYSFECTLIFNVICLFAVFCIDIDIIHYRQYTVLPFKTVFLGMMNLQTYVIEGVGGKWTTQKYTFQHPTSHLQHAMNEQETDDIEYENERVRKCVSLLKEPQPFGLWQRFSVLLFVIGMFGSIICIIDGIQKMQPFITN
mmetsp:Transcript_58203/g.96495  ORF Transcript_58203/g.96495 Transcript_58203/m.96495 type:complete len:148 (+) Transcript_58203:1-444(+)